MRHHELADPDQARRFVVQGLWLQRVFVPRVQTVEAILDWALEIAGSGEPLPPVGFVADVGHVVFQERMREREEMPHVPGWSESLSRTYEDYALGKLYADSACERAGAALCQYRDRDRVKGLAFFVNQCRQRAGFGGVLMSPAVLKTLRERPAEEVLALGWESLQQKSVMPLLFELYQELIHAVRQASGLLGPEDVFELEHRTALAGFSQRLALRQVLQVAASLETSLPTQRLRPIPRRHEVATRILDEDTYPVGGFSSISTRGTIESLLHSQLAYMESEGERPDLFDIKFLRDELLYYARDENQFLRRRRTFLFALYPDLVQARFKDPEVPWQRLVLALGFTVAIVRRLIDWLSTDALVFEFLFLERGTEPLGPEQALLEMIWREQIVNGTVIVKKMPEARLASYCVERGRRSLCLGLILCSQLVKEELPLDRMALDGPRPQLIVGEELFGAIDDSVLETWARQLQALLQAWL